MIEACGTALDVARQNGHSQALRENGIHASETSILCNRNSGFSCRSRGCWHFVFCPPPAHTHTHTHTHTRRDSQAVNFNTLRLKASSHACKAAAIYAAGGLDLGILRLGFTPRTASTSEVLIESIPLVFHVRPEISKALLRVLSTLKVHQQVLRKRLELLDTARVYGPPDLCPAPFPPLPASSFAHV